MTLCFYGMNFVVIRTA